MASMTDQTRVDALLNWMFNGGAAPTITSPYHLRLMSVQGSNTANGTELITGGGYTAGGASMGSPSFAAASSGQTSNSNIVSWSATGTWSSVVAIEVWDTAATPLRWLQGACTGISSVGNGDTVEFTAGSITVNASSW